MKQSNLKVLLEPEDLAANCRLAQVQIGPGLREAAGLRHHLKDAQLIPIHQ
jgi:hypothetical protein